MAAEHIWLKQQFRSDQEKILRSLFPVASFVDTIEEPFRFLDKMTINTDKTQVTGGTDFTFVCSKIPFTISCSNNLHHGAHNYIDLDLVNQMRIPLKKIKVRRMRYQGENLRSVGHIEQTIQCVVQGVSQGTVHLTATVVRNLFTNFNVDCIASSKTYRRLTGKDPPRPPDDGYEEEDDVCSLTSSLPDCQANLVTKEWLADQSQDLGEDEEEDVVEKDDKAIGCDARPPDPPPAPPTPAPSTKIKTRKKSVRMSTIAPSVMSFELESDQEDEDDDYDPKAPCYQHNLPGCGQCSTERYIRLAIMRGEMSRPEEIYANPPQYIYDEEELFCKTCFLGGINPKVVSNHREGCPTCPSMTPQEKEAKHGAYWKQQAEMIIKARFQAEKEKRR